ncbi:hypothetical protein [Xenorhabdus sp. Sc-CR9]|uniref:hypothetical protein n=1 Tax=Xenorhabdus sp. Sc-CR9 TaxID=2584468 RepID=UPI001F304C6D|nr:hypothetical protein [Xenorhabdus sp. Sc-CR9]
MKNSFSIENRLETFKNITKILAGKLDDNTINNIKEKLLNFSLGSYSGTAYLDSDIFYTTLELSLDIGKKFKGAAWGVESLGISSFVGYILADIDTLIEEGNNYIIGDTAGGVSITFLNSSYLPVGSFEGIGKPMIGVGKGSGHWS